MREGEREILTDRWTHGETEGYLVRLESLDRVGPGNDGALVRTALCRGPWE